MFPSSTPDPLPPLLRGPALLPVPGLRSPPRAPCPRGVPRGGRQGAAGLAGVGGAAEGARADGVSVPAERAGAVGAQIHQSAPARGERGAEGEDGADPAAAGGAGHQRVAAGEEGRGDPAGRALPAGAEGELLRGQRDPAHRPPLHPVSHSAAFLVRVNAMDA